MSRKNTILLVITFVLLAIATIVLVTSEYDSILDIVFFSILFLLIICYPTALCYEVEEYNEKGVSLRGNLTASLFLLIIFFISPYYAVLYVIKENKKDKS